MRFVLCLLVQVFSAGFSAQTESVLITGQYEVFNYYTNMREVKLAIGDPQNGGVKRYHATLAGGGSSTGYIGYFAYFNRALFIHVSQFNGTKDLMPDDELLTVRTASFVLRKTDLMLNEQLGRGSTKKEVRRVLGKPLERHMFGYRKGWLYQGRPRTFNLRFNMFGRLRKVIVS